MSFARIKSRRGFTLIEALAAFAMLALGLVVLFDCVGVGVRGDQRVAFESRAMRMAQNQLEALALATPLVEGATSGGSRGDAEWTLEVAPYAAADPVSARRGYWARVTVRATAPGLRNPFSLAVTSLKIAPRQPKAPGQ
ncbi:MAG: prepilin-type N-terminal cleavage/methylation domain-containing protein [Roseiarcus sp.]|jgi:type II secretory pathway pseudopilin PulG